MKVGCGRQSQGRDNKVINGVKWGLSDQRGRRPFPSHPPPSSPPYSQAPLEQQRPLGHRHDAVLAPRQQQALLKAPHGRLHVVAHDQVGERGARFAGRGVGTPGGAVEGQAEDEGGARIGQGGGGA